MREWNYQTYRRQTWVRRQSLIADRRHSLFGHICRLPENTPASQALQLSIETHTGSPPAAVWKRPPGRPRRNWLQQVEEDTGLSVGAAWIAGQDRSMWRTVRPSTGQAQQWVSEWVMVEYLSNAARWHFIYHAAVVKLYLFYMSSVAARESTVWHCSWTARSSDGDTAASCSWKRKTNATWKTGWHRHRGLFSSWSSKANA